MACLIVKPSKTLLTFALNRYVFVVRLLLPKQILDDEGRGILPLSRLGEVDRDRDLNLTLSREVPKS